MVIKLESFDLAGYRASRECLPPFAYRAIYADRDAQWEHRNGEEALVRWLEDHPSDIEVSLG